MTNRTVPAAAEGMPAITRPMPPIGAKPAVVAAWPTLDAGEREFITRFYALTPASQVSTLAALEAVTEAHDAEAAAEMFSVEVNAAALAACSSKQLRQLHSVALSLSDMVAGICCQPRFLSQSGAYNPAGEILSTLSDLISNIVAAALREAKARQPETRDDAVNYALTTLHDETALDDDLASLARTAATLAGTVASMEAGR